MLKRPSRARRSWGILLRITPSTARPASRGLGPVRQGFEHVAAGLAQDVGGHASLRQKPWRPRARAGRLPAHRTGPTCSPGPGWRKAWAPSPPSDDPERPAEVEDPAVPGHWEGTCSSGWSVLQSGPRRTHDPVHGAGPHAREERYGVIAHTKNGPPLAGYGAVSMKNAVTSTIASLPEHLRQSLAWDRGKEMSAHAEIQDRVRHPRLFRRSTQPLAARDEREHQRLVASVLPEGTDSARWTAEEIEAVAATLNRRPRKVLGWKTPPKPSTITYCLSNEPVLRRLGDC